MQEKKISIPLIGGIVLLVVITAGGIFLSIQNNNAVKNNTTSDSNLISQNFDEQTTDTPLSSPTASTIPTSNEEITAAYKDGTYVLETEYANPEDTTSMEVSITLKDDVITDVNVTPEGVGDSSRYQTRFSNSIASFVVGKKLNNATLRTVVNGASLSTEAFNTALQKLKVQAQI